MRSTARRTQPHTLDRIVPDGFCACPVDIAFSVVGKKWTVHLIRNMLRGHRRFNEFLANIEGLSPRTLSTRLKELEHEELILKKVTSTAPVSVEYQLTDKGHAVLPILEQMVRWSIMWAPDRVFEAGRKRADIEACVEEWESVILGRATIVQENGTTGQGPKSTTRRKLTDSA